MAIKRRLHLRRRPQESGFSAACWEQSLKHLAAAREWVEQKDAGWVLVHVRAVLAIMEAKQASE